MERKEQMYNYMNELQDLLALNNLSEKDKKIIINQNIKAKEEKRAQTIKSIETNSHYCMNSMDKRSFIDQLRESFDDVDLKKL